MIIFYKNGWNIYIGVTVIMSADMPDDENITSQEFDEENSLKCDMSGEENGLDSDMSDKKIKIWEKIICLNKQASLASLLLLFQV